MKTYMCLRAYLERKSLNISRRGKRIHKGYGGKTHLCSAHFFRFR
jgi:hypothetical protein